MVHLLVAHLDKIRNVSLADYRAVGGLNKHTIPEGARIYSGD